MRICFVIRSLNYGGAERQLVELARGLHQRGHEVTVLTFYDGGPLGADLDAAGITRRGLGKHGRWHMVSFLFRLVRVIRALHPDVVHSYATVPNLTVACMSPFLGRSRVIWGVRASQLATEAYDWTVHASVWLSARLARCADLIIANSWAGAADHVALGYPTSRIVVIPNGIDTDRFCPDPERRARVRAEWGVAANDEIVGNVARLDPMKDQSTFIRAAALVRAQRPGCRFICVGLAAAEPLRELKALADGLGVGSALTWLPPAHDPADTYRGLDIHCSSSAFGEGFSNALGEALACGVPCVATDVGDAGRLLVGIGEIVPPRTPELLASAISAMLARRSAALAQRCRSRIVEEYGIPQLLSRTEAVLGGLDG